MRSSRPDYVSERSAGTGVDGGPDADDGVQSSYGRPCFNDVFLASVVDVLGRSNCPFSARPSVLDDGHSLSSRPRQRQTVLCFLALASCWVLSMTTLCCLPDSCSPAGRRAF